MRWCCPPNTRTAATARSPMPPRPPGVCALCYDKETAPMTDILTLLHELAALHTQQAVLLAAERQALPTYLRQRLDKIAARYAPEHAECTRAIAHVTAEVKTAVLFHGASVKSEHLHAVYSAGKMAWNTDMLIGVAVNTPE